MDTGRGIEGVSLLEVAVALALLGLLLMGVLPVLVVAQRSVDRVRTQSMTQALAAAKLEQLRSLAWAAGVDASGVPHEARDTSTDLSGERPAAGGPGLAEAGLGTLLHDTAGYADFLDADGRWVGRGDTPPLGTRYVRRWAVTRPPCGTGGVVTLHVVAFAWPARASGRVPTEADASTTRLSSAKARTWR
jgi:type II secretory pathway pseudopilin PulG